MLLAKRILCPTDFSAPAEESVQTAAEMAKQFGAELVLLNVIPVLPTLPPDPNYVFKVPEYEQYLHSDAERQLNALTGRLSAMKVNVRPLIAHGPIAEEIVAVAKTENADLIVIATHGSRGWHRLVFGSVAEKVVRLAECPVLTIRPRVVAKAA
ncbi:MAG TPA: universal stress protein [Terriglobales bacterium]|jgi:nucleotide-binding universal stress UspA family protein|nr:universal stress protein [Terriglobales bacterium]